MAHTDGQAPTGRGWTDERRAKFRATMQQKRRGVPPRRPAPASAKAVATLDRDGGATWAEWKRDWLERLGDAETALAAKLALIRELKEKVEAL